MPRLDATVGVLGRFASPCFVLGRQRRSAAQRVRLASLAPSGLVWLAARPSTQDQRATRRRRSAFAMTETELMAMAALAIIGDRSRPVTGYRTPAAIGTPRAL